MSFSFSDRQELLGQLENLRRRPLIVYVTSPRPGAEGTMAKDAVPELLDQLQSLEASTKALDLLLVSDGGDPTVAWSIASLIRERVEEFAVLVPQAAYSAATLIALGADEIVMHPHGNLGPVDPQIRSIRRGEDGQEEKLQFGAEDLSSFLRFTRESVGLTDQKHLAQMFELFCRDVGSVQIGTASRSSQLSIMMGEKLLKMHMKGADQSQQAATIAESLNKNFFHHGYPLSRSEAKEIGLKIAEGNSEAEALMWEIWSSIEQGLLGDCCGGISGRRCIFSSRLLPVAVPPRPTPLALRKKGSYDRDSLSGVLPGAAAVGGLSKTSP